MNDRRAVLQWDIAILQSAIATGTRIMNDEHEQGPWRVQRESMVEGWKVQLRRIRERLEAPQPVQ